MKNINVINFNSYNLNRTTSFSPKIWPNKTLFTISIQIANRCKHKLKSTHLCYQLLVRLDYFCFKLSCSRRDYLIPLCCLLHVENSVFAEYFTSVLLITKGKTANGKHCPNSTSFDFCFIETLV